jgi:DNA-binding FadR family transcriptional regulator
MERVGLVARVEEQLERVIAQGRLPECGRFASEETLARRYGVSRGTVREALRRLAARGLVVQHPGRKTRGVALDESLTLENLGLALHDERSPGARWLLEGYFSLKRQVTVELLADCATHASQAALQRLGDGCFALWDAARWEPGERCAQLEFELLKLAAQVANRPGHLLLLQSMQRAMKGIAARVLPLVDREALGQWALCAMDALGQRDTEALQRTLPQLLSACDERILGRLAPVPQEHEAPKVLRTEEHSLGRPTPGALADEALEARPDDEERGLARLASATEEHEAFEVRPSVEELDLPRPAPAAQEAEMLAAHLLVGERGLGGLAPSVEGDLPGAVFANLSDCRTGSCALPPEGGSQPEPPSAGSSAPAGVTALEEGGPAVPEGVAPRLPLPTPQDSLVPERLQPCMSSSLMSEGEGPGRPDPDASARTGHPRWVGDGLWET